MMIKAVILFLLAMVVIGMVGNLLFPGELRRRMLPKAQSCPRCGRPLIGKGPCGCTRRKPA
jgi:hypothetical protein